MDLEHPELEPNQDRGELMVASEAVEKIDLVLVADLQTLEFDLALVPVLVPVLVLVLELPDSSE